MVSGPVPVADVTVGDWDVEISVIVSNGLASEFVASEVGPSLPEVDVGIEGAVDVVVCASILLVQRSWLPARR